MPFALCPPSTCTPLYCRAKDPRFDDVIGGRTNDTSVGGRTKTRPKNEERIPEEKKNVLIERVKDAVYDSIEDPVIRAIDRIEDKALLDE